MAFPLRLQFGVKPAATVPRTDAPETEMRPFLICDPCASRYNEAFHLQEGKPWT